MRKTIISAFLALAVLGSGFAAAQSFPDPDNTVSVIVPFGAGGGTDLVIRALVNEMNEYSPANIVISNIPGAGSANGTNELFTLPADGYTLLTSGTHTVTATLSGLTDGHHALEGIAGLHWDPFVVAVLSSRPYQSFADMLAAAYDQPGRLCLGNAGLGGATGAASIGLTLAFDDVFNVISFDGGTDLITNVLGGRCEVGIFSQSEVVANLNLFTPLVILYHERSSLPDLAEVPTLAEVGYPEVQVPGGSFRSFSVKAGTPPELKQLLLEIVRQGFESESYQAYMKTNGLLSAYSELDELDAYLLELEESFTPILREAGLLAE